MRKYVLALMCLMLFCSPGFAGGGLDGFLADLNVQARSDMGGFAARVGTQFGVPYAQVQAVIGTVNAPADAFMVFQLGQMTHRPPDAVLGVYQANRGKGWGVIAKSIGIKPGSPEFHALKRGDFVLSGKPGPGYGKGHGNGKGKGKGHNKK
ncbi:MAG: putative rane protein [Geobacteraceae bacterium]|nr:putative rane protein [Geobacteraceae bacterium]